MGFGRKSFGRKGLAPATAETGKSGGIFGNRSANGAARSGASPFERFFAEIQSERDLSGQHAHHAYHTSNAMKYLSAEERGDLLADLVNQPGVFEGGGSDSSPREKAAYNASWTIWNLDVEVRKEHLDALVSYMVGQHEFRVRDYYEEQFAKLLKLINLAIEQGAYLSSGECELIAEMAAEIRQKKASYSKSRTKKMIARAEKLEKLAGVEVSATEFLMQRCEGADNEFAIPEKARPNAQFWADLLAETASALNEIRLATKGSKKPAWGRTEAAFNAEWSACGNVRPSYGNWKNSSQPVDLLKQHNGRRNGWADPETYRSLPGLIANAAAHSRFDWSCENVPGLEVLGDLENPDWTALVEHLITQRRATKATKTWQKEALALCKPLGLETVEARLHDWLALFHSPALNRQNFTNVSNGERFAAAIERLEAHHADWPDRHANETAALGKAVAICIASGGDHGLCYDLHPQLVRLDDHTYKNKSATTGVLHMLKPTYKHADGRNSYKSLSSFMRLSVENEEFVRGALWLVALMPDRVRAIEALELTAQSAATYLWTGDDAMRSKIIANAAIATLIAMDSDDIDASVLRLSKVVEHRTIRAPLLAYLNDDG